jgi:NNP family nitrate/nitrite transporter-like MFS transporter
VPFIIAWRLRRLVRHERHRLHAKASFAEQAVIFQRKHNWIMCWLYTGTFGSFIGYSAASRCSPRRSSRRSTRCKLAFLGPLVGALSRSAPAGCPTAGAAARHLLGVRLP